MPNNYIETSVSPAERCPLSWLRPDWQQKDHAVALLPPPHTRGGEGNGKKKAKLMDWDRKSVIEPQMK